MPEDIKADNRLLHVVLHKVSVGQPVNLCICAEPRYIKKLNLD